MVKPLHRLVVYNGEISVCYWNELEKKQRIKLVCRTSSNVFSDLFQAQCGCTRLSGSAAGVRSLVKSRQVGGYDV